MTTRTTPISLLVILAIVSTAAHGRLDSTEECQNLLRSYSQSSTEIYLSSQNIPILRAKCLSEFRNVKKLHLTNCRIQQIEPDAFSTMESLVELDLSNNLLDHLPENLFDNNKQLERISLSNNKFSAAPYVSVPLKKLDLSRCSISALNFNKYLDVQFLDLGYNEMESLTSQDMDVLHKVAVINLNNNRWKCGSQFDQVLCWSLNRTGVNQERMPIKCSTRIGNFMSYTIQNRREFCEKVTQVTDSPTSKTTSQPTFMTRETGQSTVMGSTSTISETPLPKTSDDQVYYENTILETTDGVSENPLPQESIHLESDQTTTLETTYIVSQKIALGRTSEELQALNSASEKPVPDNSNGPLNTSEKSVIFSEIDPSSENIFGQNSNEQETDLSTEESFAEAHDNSQSDEINTSEDTESDLEISFQNTYYKQKYDQIIFENVNPPSELSKPLTTHRKTKSMLEAQQRVTMWMIFAATGWMSAAFSVALLIYVLIVLYRRRRYSMLENVVP